MMGNDIWKARMADTEIVCEEYEESEGGKMKPDGVSDNVYNDLINALEKAIILIYDMSIRKVAIPYDTIRKWENLVKYAREEADNKE